MRGVLLLSLFSVACFSDLSGIKIRHDGGVDDLATDEDLAGADLKGQKGDMAKPMATECPLPHLQVLVLDGRSWSGLTHDHQILRLPLDGAKTCTPLSLNHSLTQDPGSLGFLPPSTTIYGERSGTLRFIDGKDQPIGAPYVPSETYTPDFIFPLVDGDGLTRIAIAYDVSNGPLSTMIGWVDVLDATDLSVRTNHWPVGTTDNTDIIRATQVVAVDADPRDPTRFLAAREDGAKSPTQAFAAPWDEMPVLPTTWVMSLDNDDLARNLRTLRHNGAARAAWIFSAPQFASSGFDDKVVHRSEKSGSAAQQWGPVTCKSTTDCTLPLQLSDAIPDFTDDTAILATCFVDHSAVTDAGTSNLIRIHSDGTCETLLKGELFPESHYLTTLVAALPE